MTPCPRVSFQESKVKCLPQNSGSQAANSQSAFKSRARPQYLYSRSFERSLYASLNNFPSSTSFAKDCRSPLSNMPSSGSCKQPWLVLLQAFDGEVTNIFE